jgi:hypothetical protein
VVYITWCYGVLDNITNLLHLLRTDDVVHKMSEISTYENHRSGVKYYWAYIGIECKGKWGSWSSFGNKRKAVSLG